MKMLSEQIKRELQSQPPNHTQHKHYSIRTQTRRGMHVHSTQDTVYRSGLCWDVASVGDSKGHTHEFMILSWRTKAGVLISESKFRRQ